MLCCVSHIDNMNGCHLCDECIKINLACRLSQAWVHFVTDHGMSGLPILAKFKHFQTMRILQIILQLIQALPFCFDGRPNKGLKLETVALPFYSPNRNDSPRIFEHVLLRHTPSFIPVMNNLTFSVSLVLLEAFQNGCIFPHRTMCLTVSFALPWWICHGFFSVFLPRFFFIGTQYELPSDSWSLFRILEMAESSSCRPAPHLQNWTPFSKWFKRCGHCAVAVLCRASMKFDFPIS